MFKPKGGQGPIAGQIEEGLRAPFMNHADVGASVAVVVAGLDNAPHRRNYADNGRRLGSLLLKRICDHQQCGCAVSARHAKESATPSITASRMCTPTPTVMGQAGKAAFSPDAVVTSRANSVTSTPVVTA